MNTGEFKKTIADLYRKMSSLVAFPNQMEPWGSASENEMYELRFCLANRHKYVLVNMETKAEETPDGWYVFVNRIDEPGIIRVAEYPHYGHSTLTYYQTQLDGIYDNMPVYYAGLVIFDDGELTNWSNSSGHYRPTAELSENFIPYVRRLLPPHLFMSF